MFFIAKIEINPKIVCVNGNMMINEIINNFIIAQRKLYESDNFTHNNYNLLKKEYADKIKIVMNDKGYKFIGEGRDRIVYKKEKSNYVVKVPIGEHGITANQNEADNYKRELKLIKPSKDCLYAKCRLVKSYLLVMEYVEPISYKHERFPDWGDFIDCGQVGITKDDRVVAYDYAQ
jgi:hypothetical protein